MMNRVSILALCFAVAACGTDEEQLPDDLEPAGDEYAEARVLRWREVDRIARQAFELEGIDGMGLAIYDASDRKVFERMYGDFHPDRQVAIASASKMVAGMTLFGSIARGELSLDSTTGGVLGWTGPKAAITLRHLLSFTSGLDPEHACILNGQIDLATCVATIAGTPRVAAPGTRFDYGSTHLAVAGRMAEVASGKRWNQLFAETVAAPLGLPASVTYYTAPRQATGTTNPFLAGGMRASMNQYAALLATVYHRGAHAGATIGTPALYDQQAVEPFPSVAIGHSPYSAVGYGFRYGLTAWLECSTPAAGCTVVSSPGGFGWTPWVDREHGYYAILGMEIPPTGGPGVASYAVDLAQQLKPAIVAALAP